MAFCVQTFFMYFHYREIVLQAVITSSDLKGPSGFILVGIHFSCNNKISIGTNTKAIVVPVTKPSAPNTPANVISLIPSGKGITAATSYGLVAPINNLL